MQSTIEKIERVIPKLNKKQKLHIFKILQDALSEQNIDIPLWHKLELKKRIYNEKNGLSKDISLSELKNNMKNKYGI